LQGQQISQPKRKQPNDRDAGGMANSPAQPGRPGTPGGADGQWRNRREVIGTGPNMYHACDQAGEGSNHCFGLLRA